MSDDNTTNVLDAVFRSGSPENGDTRTNKLVNWDGSDGLPPDGAYDDARNRMLAHRERCDDWHVKGKCLEVRHYGGKPFLTREGREGQKVYFSDFSLRQFCKALGLHHPTVRKLQADGRLDLMTDLMMHYLHSSGRREHLLRLCAAGGGESASTIHELRAFLPASYNRLDNIYLLSGIQQACSKYDLLWKDLYCDRDNFMCRLILRGERNKWEFLKEEGDTFVCGISLENSEVGGLGGDGKSLTAKIYFERLVCTNGMTAKDSRALRVRSNLNMETHYRDTLPPYPLGFGLQEEIDDFLVKDVIGQFMPDIEKQANFLQRQAKDMHTREIVLESESCAREIIGEIVRLAGMRSGASIPRIYGALVRELESAARRRRDANFSVTFPITVTAWDLYNAVTRYASSLIIQREGVRRNYRLGSTLTWNTHRLSEPSLWQEIQRQMELRPEPRPPGGNTTVTPPRPV